MGPKTFINLIMSHWDTPCLVAGTCYYCSLLLGLSQSTVLLSSWP